MSVPTATDLAGLGYAFLGEPFVSVQTSTADTTTLSFALLGQPLFAFSPATAGRSGMTPPAGSNKGSNKGSRKRYQLPNGMQVYATPEEALLLLRQLADTVPDQPIVKAQRTRAKFKPIPLTVTLNDGFQQPVQMLPVPDLVAMSRMADLDAIAFDNLMELIKQRKRNNIALLLLLS